MGLVCSSIPMALRNDYPAFADVPPCPQVSGNTITWVVPHAPGGGYDRYSRLIEPYFETALGSEIVIKNLPGAGGIVGARTILNALTDGRTIGIINGAGLLAAALAGEKRAPNPVRDFTILGRIGSSHQVWGTGRDSLFLTIDDVFMAGQKRPIIFGMKNVGSLNFINMTLTSHLLGLDIEIVAGYMGSGAGVMAALRSEVDLVVYSFESINNHIENGDIRPLLQISNSRISSHPSLDNIPILGGTQGFAAQRASQDSRNIDGVLADVNAIVNIIGAGRLIVAPLGMKQELSDCLEKILMETLHNPAFQANVHKANLSLDIAAAEEARGDLLSVSERIDHFIPIIQEAIQKVRG
ncbi:Bug family tripartite tricarboxylate transporter substrate binding protein [Acidobacteriota bacterium]